jgi:hypothetical protein
MRVPGVERIDKNNGSASLRVRGLEFARSAGPELLFGLAQRAAARPDNLAEAAQLAREIGRFRSPAARDRGHPLYRQDPEAWLESAVRAHLETVDPALFTTPVYGQVPAFAGGDRGVLDLLAAERDGRLVVIELKASADLHLPLQALDYWMRVKWHLDREEFTPKGYFPGLALRREAPRLVLLSPALEFHPTTEVILSFFKPAIAVERVGVGLEWRKRLEVVFRARGAERPL